MKIISKNPFFLCKSESGQGVIEFAIMLLFVVGFAFFMTQLSAYFTVANYAQYATFMAARAYMAGGLNQEDQFARADVVLVRMLRKSSIETGVDRWPAVARSLGGNARSGVADVGDGPALASDKNLTKDFSWQEGVRYEFVGRVKFATYGKPSSGSTGDIKLTSESWLGRSPTYEECRSFMEQKGYYFDNGC